MIISIIGVICAKASAAVSSLLTGLYAVYKAESNALASLTTNLYAVYKGESNANDSLGAYNGTAQGGLTYTAGKSGNAFTFNGINSRIDLPTASFNSLTTDFSVSAWTLFPTGYIGTDAIPIFNNMSATSWFAGAGGFWVTFFGDVIQFRIGDKSTAPILTYATAVSMGYNTFFHIAVTRSSGRSRIYLNGTLVASNTDAVNPVYYTSGVNTTTPTIGAIKMPNGVQDSYYAPSNTKIDELNIWNKELTATEVTDLYNAGTGKFYQANAFYSTIVNDSLGTYNGTAQGGLTYSAGKSGNAFTFNGTNAYVSLPTNQFNFTGDFTISAWVNISGLYISSNAIHLMVNLNCDGAWFQNLKGIWFQIANQTLALSLFNSGTANDVTWNDTTGSIIKSGSGWFHVVTTRKGGTGSKIYLNGVLKNSNTNTLDANFHTNYQTPAIGNNRILNRSGAVATSDVYAPDGVLIDEYNVWNKELTSTEVTNLYNAGTGKFYPTF